VGRIVISSGALKSMGIVMIGVRGMIGRGCDRERLTERISEESVKAED